MAPPTQSNGTNYPQSPFQSFRDYGGAHIPDYAPAGPVHSAHGHPASLPHQLDNQTLSQNFLNQNAYQNFSAEGRAYQNGTYNPSGASSNAAANTEPRYNPAQLLDPRGYSNQQPQSQQNGQGRFTPAAIPAAQQLFSFDSPGGSPAVNGSPQPSYGMGNSYYNYQNQDPQGMGNMMERFHGVSDRTNPPQKRRKIDISEDDASKKKAVFTGDIGRGGVLGNAMREYREQGAKETFAKKPAPIDLTSGMFGLARMGN